MRWTPSGGPREGVAKVEGAVRSWVPLRCFEGLLLRRPRWACGRRERVVQARRRRRERHVHGGFFEAAPDPPHRHWRPPGQRLVRPESVVKGEPGRDPDARLVAVGVGFEVDLLVLERGMNTLSSQRPRPSIEMLMPAADSLPVKAALVNWLPWSVLKISGRPKRASASSSARTQKPASSVFDSCQLSTARLAQSMIATR